MYLKTNGINRFITPAFTGTLVCFVAALFASLIIWKMESVRIKSDRLQLANITADYAHAITQAIERSISPTYLLSAFVSQSNGALDDFESVANGILPFFPGTTLQLAPGGIVKKIYPIEGNEGAIGHDLFNDPTRAKEAMLAKTTGELTLAGPFNLKQGGIGAVARLPVYLDKNNEIHKFWGFTIVLIRFPDVLDSAQLSHLITKGFQYELWRLHPDTKKKQIITSSTSEQLIEPVDQIINVPNGHWTLSVSPTNGWSPPFSLSIKVLPGLIFSLMLGYIAALIVKMRENEKTLEDKVKQRTSSLEEEIEIRKKAESLSHANETRFRSLLDTIPDLIWVKDENGVYISCNAQYERFLGAKEKDIIGKTDYDFVEKELADLFRENDRQAIKSSKPRSNEEYIVYPDDGRQVFLYTTKAPMYNPDGSLLGVLGIGRDITELRQGEEERVKLENQLKQAQKMEAIGTLAGGIAHDFNNILFAILGYSELAQANCPSGSTIRKDIDRVIEASCRARDLVKQILAFSRQTETEKIIMNPGTIVKEALKLLRASIPTTIKIQQHIDLKAGTIYIDPTHIHQIVNNLCTNAYHAIGGGRGTITVSLKRLDLTQSDLLSEPEVQPGPFICLSVGDTGSGIHPANMDRIFDPYFTTKEVGAGTGMGLAITHGLSKKAGGFITCKSILGEGTIFDVYIPIHSDTELLEHDSKTVNQVEDGNERILFIDDEAMLAELGKTMLGRLGYQVTAVTSSLEAIEIFRNQPDNFDLVITDHTMPEMTGTDMARLLLQMKPDLPVILLTGFSNTISEERAKLYGIRGFALKPVAIKDLAILIRKIIDGRD